LFIIQYGSVKVDSPVKYLSLPKEPHPGKAALHLPSPQAGRGLRETLVQHWLPYTTQNFSALKYFPLLTKERDARQGRVRFQ
jgi:hypothetical protein